MSAATLKPAIERASESIFIPQKYHALPSFISRQDLTRASTIFSLSASAQSIEPALVRRFPSTQIVSMSPPLESGLGFGMIAERPSLDRPRHWHQTPDRQGGDTRHSGNRLRLVDGESSRMGFHGRLLGVYLRETGAIPSRNPQ